MVAYPSPRGAYLVAVVAAACAPATSPHASSFDGGLYVDGDADARSSPAGDAALPNADDAAVAPRPASCKKGGSGRGGVSKPVQKLVLKDRWHEGWLASPAVADLDRDGRPEIVVVRESVLVAFRADGTQAFRYESGKGRIWASPVVGNFVGDDKLEVAIAAGNQVTLLDSDGRVVSGFPVLWQAELRTLAAADIDGDGRLDLAFAVARGGATDVVHAIRGDGAALPGFPPNASGRSGCTGSKAPAPCYLAGAFDQNLALGDLDGRGGADVVVPHDNAYASFHEGTGVAFDAHTMFTKARKVPGVRYLHNLAEAVAGYAEDEESALQAHFTNTAPAIADIDRDGMADIVMLGSVQNASQSQREKGVGLWVMRPDGSRHPKWETPYVVAEYLAGLWDLGDNIVGATNQVTVADISAAAPGLELVFAGFDGRIHAVGSSKEKLWSYVYTTEKTVLTSGVAVADLSQDGSPEIVFTTYSTAQGKSALFVLDAAGTLLHRVDLPRRGAMGVPTIADIDGDGEPEIVVSLKDAEDKVASVVVYGVAGAGTNCLLWPTGRANLARNGWVRASP